MIKIVVLHLIFLLISLNLMLKIKLLNLNKPEFQLINFNRVIERINFKI